MRRKRKAPWKYPARKKRVVGKGSAGAAAQERQKRIKEFASQVGLSEGDPNLGRFDAYIKAQQGRREEAIADLGRLTKQGCAADRAIAFIDRSFLKRQQGDLAGAIADLGQAIELHQDSYAFDCRGTAKHAAKDFAGAIADFDRAIELGTGDMMVLEKRGTAKFRAGDVAGAIADFDQALASNPDSVSTIKWRSVARASAGDIAGARADMEMAARVRSNRPTIVETHPREVILHLAKLGQDIELTRKQIALGTKPRSEAKLSEKQVQDAISHFGKFLKGDDQTIPVAALFRAHARAVAGDLPGALADTDLAWKLGVGKAEALANRGIIKQRAGDIKGAAADLRQARAIAPANPEVRKLQELLKETRH